MSGTIGCSWKSADRSAGRVLAPALAWVSEWGSATIWGLLAAVIQSSSGCQLSDACDFDSEDYAECHGSRATVCKRDPDVYDGFDWILVRDCSKTEGMMCRGGECKPAPGEEPRPDRCATQSPTIGGADDPSNTKVADLPVTSVTDDEARRFCQYVGGRLPDDLTRQTIWVSGVSETNRSSESALSRGSLGSHAHAPSHPWGERRASWLIFPRRLNPGVALNI